jgi:SAM-dependent methyltransferase
VVRCETCGLVYLSPRVRGDIVLEGYASAEDATFFAQNPMRIRTFARVLRGLAKEVSFGRGTRVVDVGCAGGAFVKAATDMGCEAVGVEPSAWLTERGRAAYGIDVRAGTLEDQRFPDASFDVATLWDVIEHLGSPRDTLREIRRVVRPGGHLIVNFPDHGSLVRRAMGWSWPFFLSVHLSYFTTATMERLLDGAGFRVLSSRPFWQTLPLGYVFARAANVFSPFALANRVVEKLSLANLPFTYQLGQTLTVARLDGDRGSRP